MQHLYNNFLQEHSTTPKIDLLCLYTLKCKLSLQTNELVSLNTKYSLKASSVQKLLNSQETRGYKCLHYYFGEIVTWALRELNQVDIVTNTRAPSLMQEMLFVKQSLRRKKKVLNYILISQKKQTTRQETYLRQCRIEFTEQQRFLVNSVYITLVFGS